LAALIDSSVFIAAERGALSLDGVLARHAENGDGAGGDLGV
jgi:hypothetical protein